MQHLIFPERLAVQSSQTPRSVPSPALQKGLAALNDKQLQLYRSVGRAEDGDSNSFASDDTAALELFRLLSVLDSNVAERWHWKDTRKVLRNVEIIAQHNCLVSEVIADQDVRPVYPR